MTQLDIVHTVTPLAQTKSMSCWAAAAAMLLTWKNGIPYTEFTAAKTAGNNYVIAFQENTGLRGTEIGPLAAALVLATEVPQSYTAEGYANLVRAHGPLWIGTAIFSSTAVYRHVRVLRGVRGDGTANGTSVFVVDPDGGRDYQVSMANFSKELEEIAKQDLGAGANLNPQVIRFP